MRSIEMETFDAFQQGHHCIVGTLILCDLKSFLMLKKRRLKLLAMAFDQYLTCQIFPLRFTNFPVKTNHAAQWVHLFSMV